MMMLDQFESYIASANMVELEAIAKLVMDRQRTLIRTRELNRKLMRYKVK